jgi:ssDNA-binding Zn-finger/Zn-ribbon topoisomerase 1
MSREVTLPRSDVEDPMKCPSCGNGHVLLEGRFYRDYVLEVNAGVAKDEQIAREFKRVVTAINCPQCDIRFTILQDNVFRQKKEIVSLRLKLAEIQDTTPATEKKEYVQ